MRHCEGSIRPALRVEAYVPETPVQVYTSEVFSAIKFRIKVVDDGEGIIVVLKKSIYIAIVNGHSPSNFSPKRLLRDHHNR